MVTLKVIVSPLSHIYTFHFPPKNVFTTFLLLHNWNFEFWMCRPIFSVIYIYFFLLFESGPPLGGSVGTHGLWLTLKLDQAQQFTHWFKSLTLQVICIYISGRAVVEELGRSMLENTNLLYRAQFQSYSEDMGRGPKASIGTNHVMLSCWKGGHITYTKFWQGKK